MNEMDLIEKRISSTVIAKIGPFEYCLDKVLLPNGEEKEKSLVRHPGGVAVLAVNGKGEIAMVRQYRYAVSQFLDEIPAGKLDKIPGETPMHGAERELREETGMVAGKLTYLGMIYPSPGIISEQLRLFFAEDLSQSSQELDDDEFLNVGWWPVAKLEECIRDGKIEDAKTICAFQIARGRGLI